MGIGLVNESFISKEASEAHKVCLQSLMTVQHQLKVYIELICQFLCQLSKKSGARDRVQPPLLELCEKSAIASPSLIFVMCGWTKITQTGNHYIVVAVLLEYSLQRYGKPL